MKLAIYTSSYCILRVEFISFSRTALYIEGANHEWIMTDLKRTCKIVNLIEIRRREICNITIESTSFLSWFRLRSFEVFTVRIKLQMWSTRCAPCSVSLVFELCMSIFKNEPRTYFESLNSRIYVYQTILLRQGNPWIFLAWTRHFYQVASPQQSLPDR